MYIAGHCVLLQDAYTHASSIVDIIRAGPEPLQSHFSTGYGMVLKILNTRTLEYAKTFVQRSFNNYLGKVPLLPKQLTPCYKGCLSNLLQSWYVVVRRWHVGFVGFRLLQPAVCPLSHAWLTLIKTRSNNFSVSDVLWCMTSGANLPLFVAISPLLSPELNKSGLRQCYQTDRLPHASSDFWTDCSSSPHTF